MHIPTTIFNTKRGHVHRIEGKASRRTSNYLGLAFRVFHLFYPCTINVSSSVYRVILFILFLRDLGNYRYVKGQSNYIHTLSIYRHPVRYFFLKDVSNGRVNSHTIANGGKCFYPVQDNGLLFSLACNFPWTNVTPFNRVLRTSTNIGRVRRIHATYALALCGQYRRYRGGRRGSRSLRVRRRVIRGLFPRHFELFVVGGLLPRRIQER